MSTILKALQRLEQETESARPTGVTPVFSRPQSTVGGVAGWFLNPWVRRTVVGLVIIALGATATYYYRQSRGKITYQAGRSAATAKPIPSGSLRGEQTEPAAVADRAIPKAGSTRFGPARNNDPSAVDKVAPVPTGKFKANGFAQNAQPSTLPRALRTRDSRAGQFSKPQTPDDALARPPNSASERAKPEDAADTAAAEISAPPKENTAVGNMPVKNQANPVEDKAKIAAPDTYTNTPQLTDGRLKIHAIAWSQSVEERMAVVNNRVVYEGDSVDNFVVVAIRPDDVVVREKGQGVWKVVFGRP